MTTTRNFVAAVALAVVTLGSAAAADHAVIRFADYGGISNWRAADDGSLLIETRNRKWYRATFSAPCHPLKFEQTISFVTDGVGQLDKFGSIVADGQQCWFDTFEEISDPELFDEPD